MPAVITEVNASGFADMCTELARMSGKTYEDVIRLQVGALLKNCLAHTPARKREAIIKRVSRSNNYIEFESGHIISFWKKADALMFLDDSNFKARKGQAEPRSIGGKTWHDMSGNRHWSNERWARWQAFNAQADKRKRDPKKELASRGVAKNSWLQIADDLGVSLDAPAYVRNAAPRNGRTYKNGLAREVLEAAAVYIEISNDNPIVVNGLNGAAILARGLEARQAAFLTDLQKGTFDDIAHRAKRYPGIFVN